MYSLRLEKEFPFSSYQNPNNCLLLLLAFLSSCLLGFLPGCFKWTIYFVEFHH